MKCIDTVSGPWLVQEPLVGLCPSPPALSFRSRPLGILLPTTTHTHSHSLRSVPSKIMLWRSMTMNVFTLALNKTSRYMVGRHMHSTQTTCAPVWTAVFGGRVASSFRSLSRPYKYISGGAHVPLGVNSTRTVLNPWHTCKRRTPQQVGGKPNPWWFTLAAMKATSLA